MKISVILPNYNGERCIEKAIKSFIAQNYENKELIIVDGKSKDNSHQIIHSYTLEYPTIIKWVQEKDINVTDAINIGIKHASGDYISFLASDVFYFSDDLFSFINKKSEQMPFDAIYFDHYRYHPQDKTILLVKCPNILFNKTNLLTYGTIVGFDNIFISKKVYEKHVYNPEYNLCSDWEFFLRICEEKLLFLYVEKVCAVDVQDGQNLSIKYYDEQMEQVKIVGHLYNSENLKLYFEDPPKQDVFVPSFSFRAKSLLKRIINKSFGL